MTVREVLGGWLLAGVAAAALSAEAGAGGLALREQSAVGQGSSFAGAGTPGMGLSAMFWNPAAVTQARGLWTEVHGTLVLPNSDINVLPGTTLPLVLLGEGTGNIGEVGVIPASYTAYQISPDWYVGLAVSAPFGLSTRMGIPSPSQQLALRGSAMSIDVNPVVGWRINDWLSVAAGPRLMWFKGEFSRAALPLPVSPGNVATLDTDDYGWGFSAGVTITPGPNTEIALGYRSQVDLNLEGNADLPALAGLPPGPFPITGDVTLPDMLTLGVRQRVSDRFTLLGTVEWTNWGVVQNVPFNITGGPLAGTPPGTPVTTLTFNYRDGWFFSLGGEYEWDPVTTLRAGIGYEISPVTDEIRDPSLPDNNRWWFSAGVSRKILPQLTMDFGYSFIWVESAPINVVPGHPDYANLLPGLFPGVAYVAEAETDIHIVSVALRYKWNETAPRPVIAKY
jgi:long-chain fatty acid transport protein